ncbi:hypothetical protein [Alienimonas sp. DA493]|uniref:hypothetical protein n=1 Tax=Alienimonas sp. DA493 TaxID=3373605 RepID=UPI003754974F
MNPFNVALTLGIAASVLGVIVLAGALLGDGNPVPGVVALALGVVALAAAAVSKKLGRDEKRLPPK